MSIKTTIAKTVAKQVLLVKKESPTILFVAGVVGVTTSTVLACKATLKVGEVLSHAEKTTIEIESSVGQPLKNGGAYSVQDAVRDRSILKIQTATKIVKLYGPAIIVGAIGVACLGGSHYLLNKRNAAVTAALAGLEHTHREYRRRVAQELGEDKERELHYESQVAAASDKNKDGSPSKSRRKSPHDSSIYARFFDQTNPEWNRQPEYNRVFLHHQQEYANNRLTTRGYLFLNEVYKSLGFEPTKAGQVVGWVLSEDGSTDNYVDFGIFDGSTREMRAFVNGDEPSILLDFNVAGNILDRVNLRD